MAPTCSPQASTTAQVDWPPASVHKSPREGVNARRRSPPPPPPPKLQALGGGLEKLCGKTAGTPDSPPTPCWPFEAPALLPSASMPCSGTVCKPNSDTEELCNLGKGI